jgi:hypothetical protein
MTKNVDNAEDFHRKTVDFADLDKIFLKLNKYEK